MKRSDTAFFKPFSAIHAVNEGQSKEANETKAIRDNLPLEKAKVISLFPTEDSVLIIKHGRVWATVGSGAMFLSLPKGIHLFSLILHLFRTI
jgi:hypothetical protein